MQFNENWLREWVDPDIDSAELSELLTLAGLEVESLEPACDLDLSSANRKRLVVGRIEEVLAHPNTDKLKVLMVSVGGKRLLKIACGAPNAVTGMNVPVARAGARLPTGDIRRSEIRGVTSEGMLCSAKKLGMAEQSSGLMELDPDVAPGTLLSDHLSLDDRIFELGLTPNRGDCLGVFGIAREVAVLTGSRMRGKVSSPVKALRSDFLRIQLEAPAQCARFAGRIVRNIDMQARSPDRLQEKLRRAGLRAINPVVDITNLVMLETGQPMHAYDLDRLSGGITARLARKGEQLELLDGSTVKLKADDLVIADDSQAVGLAGIMGGSSTAISGSTQNIFFEAAFFSPYHMQGKARRIGMHTDASHRFERGVDPTGQVDAVELATRLLLEISGGNPGRLCHAVSRRYLPRKSTIFLDRREIPRILGIRVPSYSIQRILKRLGMKVTPAQGGWNVVPPDFRFDISGPHDLVEEIGRCHGFGNIPPRMPASVARQGANTESAVRLPRIRLALTSRGYHEVINYSFVDPGMQKRLLECGQGIRIANPLAENMAEMRQSLLPGLLGNLERNVNRQETSIRLFETGNIFLKRGKRRVEHPKVAALAAGPAFRNYWDTPPRELDFFDLKGDLTGLLALTGDPEQFEFTAEEHPLFHPGQSAEIFRQGKTVGHLGQLHPMKVKSLLDVDIPVYAFELDLTVLGNSKLPRFQSLSRFPSLQRDISIVVDDGVKFSDLLPPIRKAAGKDLKSIDLFDIYTGENIKKSKKSLAFSLVFRSESRNLTSREIDHQVKTILAILQQEFGAELRT